MASEQTGWVIETARHSYWTGRAIDDFSDDISWAVRFARFEDGEMVRCRLMSPHLSMLVRVTEHIWTLPPVRAEEPTARIDELAMWVLDGKKLPDSTVVSVGYWTADPSAMLGERFDAVVRTTLGDLRKQFAAALPPVQEPK